jgi:ankyrin repeat protein
MGADINQKDRNGTTALMVALQINSDDFAQFLINQKALTFL